jgi:hypothetical protein
MNTATAMTTDARKPFTKIVRIGTAKHHNGRTKVLASTFCMIEFTADGRLSITGVEGPTRGGDALGSSGQIGLCEWRIVEYAPGWSAKTEAVFRALWNRWHLNDMRPGCAHQRGADWQSDEKVEIVTYKLTTQTFTERRAIETRVLKALRDGGTVTLGEDDRALLNLPYDLKCAPDADGPESGRYEVDKRETKYIGHVYPHEHPKGLLCKPCPECGYKYGSEWRHEDVPDEVLAWLCALPDTDVTPAWI